MGAEGRGSYPMMQWDQRGVPYHDAMGAEGRGSYPVSSGTRGEVGPVYAVMQWDWKGGGGASTDAMRLRL